MSAVVWFRTLAKQRRHCKDHMVEVGATNCAEYVTQALEFMTQPMKAGLQQCDRSGGATIRFDTTSHEFGIQSHDGFLVTYFRPDPAIHGLASNMLYYQQECLKP